MVVILNRDDVSVFLLSLTHLSLTNQSLLLALVLTKTTYSELLFDIKLSLFKYGRLFLLHS